MRAWIAFAFGLIHGFGFANVLREMDLPGRALGWTLFAFNLGVEIGQLFVVVIVASALAWIRSRSEIAGTAARICRVHHRDAGRRVLVRSTGVFFWRHGMKRIVCSHRIGRRRRAVVRVCATAGPAGAGRRSREAEGQPLRAEGGRRQHHRLRPVERHHRRRHEEPGMGRADSREDQGAQPQAGDHHHQHAHARRSRERQRGISRDGRHRRAGEHRGQHEADAGRHRPHQAWRAAGAEHLRRSTRATAWRSARSRTR